jgi:hypothetical protein
MVLLRSDQQPPVTTDEWHGWIFCRGPRKQRRCRTALVSSGSSIYYNTRGFEFDGRASEERFVSSRRAFDEERRISCLVIAFRAAACLLLADADGYYKTNVRKLVSKQYIQNHVCCTSFERQQEALTVSDSCKNITIWSIWVSRNCYDEFSTKLRPVILSTEKINKTLSLTSTICVFDCFF